MSPLPFLRAGIAEFDRVSRNLPSRDPGVGASAASAAFTTTGSMTMPPIENLADDRRHDDYGGRRDRYGNDHLAQAVEPARDPVK